MNYPYYYTINNIDDCSSPGIEENVRPITSEHSSLAATADVLVIAPIPFVIHLDIRDIMTALEITLMINCPK